MVAASKQGGEEGPCALLSPWREGVIRKLFMRINSLKALEDPFIFPLTPAARKHQAIRILFATPAEGAPKAIVNLMIIL
eukprot:scaffold8633_cov154-Isochrysis_galbana.AAC.1